MDNAMESREMSVNKFSVLTVQLVDSSTVCNVDIDKLKIELS